VLVGLACAALPATTATMVMLTVTVATVTVTVTVTVVVSGCGGGQWLWLWWLWWWWVASSFSVIPHLGRACPAACWWGRGCGWVERCAAGFAGVRVRHAVGS
jgi:hypothetical protein